MCTHSHSASLIVLMSLSRLKVSHYNLLVCPINLSWPFRPSSTNSGNDGAAGVVDDDDATEAVK